MDEFDIQLNRLIYIEERMNMLAFEGETFKYSDEFNNKEADRLADIIVAKKLSEKVEKMVEEIWTK